MKDGVWLRIEGIMLERFTERAAEEGAQIREVKRKDRLHIDMLTDEASAKIVQALAGRFSMKCEMIGRCGNTRYIYKIRQRISLLAGVAAFVFTLAAFFTRIWIVDVRFSNAQATEEMQNQAQEILTDMGVVPGTWMNRLDMDKIESEMNARMQDVTYVGVRRRGVTVVVSIAGAKESPDVYNIGSTHDIIATCDGVVTRIDVYAGRAAVQAGETVRKGQTLIEGVEKIDKETDTTVAARGRVIARVWYTGEAAGATKMTETKKTGRSAQAVRLDALKWTFPIQAAQQFAAQNTRDTQIPIVGMFVPVTLIRSVYEEIEVTTHAVDAQTVKDAIAPAAWDEARAQLQPEDTISGEWITFEEIPSTSQIRARATIEVQTDIARAPDTKIGGS